MQIIIHIGVHKTATTWLQQKLFSSHPEINLINNFMYPWNDDLISYLIKSSSFSPEYCRDIFEERIKNNTNKTIVISTEEFIGHPFSGGYNKKLIANRLSQVFPDAKIILTIRNQADITYSLYQQMVKMGYLGSISQMLNEDFWSRPGFRNEFFDYYSIYKLYTGLFKAQNIGVFSQEQLKSNSEFFIKNVCDFIGVDSTKFKLDVKPVAKSLSEKKIKAIRFMNHFRNTEYNPYPVFQMKNKVGVKVMVKLISLLPFLGEQKKIYEELHKRKIYEFFRKSNESLFNKVPLDIETKSKYY